MSAHPETTPALGPSDAPTKPYTLPAWLKRWVSRTNVQAIRSTPTVASANASGTARPMVPAVPCGFMLAAIEGAMRASEIPTASHSRSSRRRPGPSTLPALLTSVAMLTPLLCRISRIEGLLDPPRRMPSESRHRWPWGSGADSPRARAAPPAHPPEPHSRPASRPPGLSVIPPFPARVCAISHVPSPHSTGPDPSMSIDASNGRRTGKPTLPAIGNYASDLRGGWSEPMYSGYALTALRLMGRTYWP